MGPVRQFSEITEVLQEETMEFVNSIAKIVHMEVAMHGGATNKNVGDAFLCVWRFPVQLSDGSKVKYSDIEKVHFVVITENRDPSVRAGIHQREQESTNVNRNPPKTTEIHH
jgi:class 3 adenylate cyclase